MTAPDPLIDAYLEGDLDDRQALALQTWLSADREHVRAFVRLTALHSGLRRALSGSAAPSAPSSRPISARRARTSARRALPRWIVPALAAGLMFAVGGVLLARSTPVDSDERVVVTAGAAVVERNRSTVEVRVGDALAPGDRLRVTEGELMLAYIDGTVLSFAAGTQAHLPAAVAGTAGKRVGIDHGRLRASVARQPAGRPLVIVTADVDLTVIGTELSCTCSVGSTRLEVASGRVRVGRHGDGQSVEAGAGDYVQAVPGQALEVRVQPAATVSAVALRVGGPRHNRLLGADGRRFVMKGVQVHVVPWGPSASAAQRLLAERAFAGRGAQFAALRLAGINTARVFVGGEVAFAADNGLGGGGGDGIAGYVQRLATWVADARAAGITVLICYHGDDAWENDAHWPRYQRLFATLVPALRPFDNVLYELVNTYQMDDQAWMRASLRSIAAFRALDYRGPLVAGLNHYGNWWYSPLVDQLARQDRQLVFSLHYYKWMGWDDTATRLAHGANYPVILGEFGRDVRGDVGETEAIAAAAAMRVLVMQDRAIGAVANGWNVPPYLPGLRGNVMTDDEAGLMPNAWGVGYRDAFSGTLPDWIEVAPVAPTPPGVLP